VGAKNKRKNREQYKKWIARVEFTSLLKSDGNQGKKESTESVPAEFLLRRNG